ncbi:hypothetical protein ACWD1Y_00575 [Streptomyces sp. NPDC002814]
MARSAGVSMNYLRRQPDIASQIIRLRAFQHQQKLLFDPESSNAEVVVLRSRLLEQEVKHGVQLAELNRRNRQLEEQLAAAQSEILRLRSQS